MKLHKHLSQSWNHHFSLHLTTLIVVSSCLAILLAGVILARNFDRIVTSWGDELQITAYLSEDFEEESKVKTFIEEIQSWPEVGQVKMISREMALADFRGQMASYAPDLAKDDELTQLIPASLQISLSHEVKANRQLVELQKLAAKLKERPGIEEVSFGQEWVKKYSQFSSLMDYAFLILGSILLSASLFVISNVIRASIENRRREIEILELLGATSSMIRKPYLFEGMLIGFLCSVLAILINALLYYGVQNILAEQLSFMRVKELIVFAGPLQILLFILVGSVIGFLSSWICVRKINSGWSAAAALASVE